MVTVKIPRGFSCVIVTLYYERNTTHNRFFINECQSLYIWRIYYSEIGKPCSIYRIRSKFECLWWSILIIINWWLLLLLSSFQLGFFSASKSLLYKASSIENNMPRARHEWYIYIPFIFVCIPSYGHWCTRYVTISNLGHSNLGLQVYCLLS